MLNGSAAAVAVNAGHQPYSQVGALPLADLDTPGGTPKAGKPRHARSPAGLENDGRKDDTPDDF